MLHSISSAYTACTNFLEKKRVGFREAMPQTWQEITEYDRCADRIVQIAVTYLFGTLSAFAAVASFAADKGYAALENRQVQRLQANSSASQPFIEKYLQQGLGIIQDLNETWLTWMQTGRDWTYDKLAASTQSASC